MKRSSRAPLSSQETHSLSPSKRGGDMHQSAVMSVSPKYGGGLSGWFSSMSVNDVPNGTKACAELTSRERSPTWAGGLK
ncbi:hypothetical protein [Thermomonospora cellulosilytica]|uniref:Uncharacterized protein n=1 Tax=Thermomonospora cellulosilytica TaxID=1411118 RepID=A0A7W3N0J7_9ACTN|nr:hypothetical protein [Thermomonospora cellulosilytica]MBA9005301.1 hypothetical protein [Thermomonospora cellulosilytica]